MDVPAIGNGTGIVCTGLVRRAAAVAVIGVLACSCTAVDSPTPGGIGSTGGGAGPSASVLPTEPSTDLPTLTTGSVSGSAGASTRSASPTVSRLGTVDRVSDGDTVVVDGLRTRLIGIDAPESADPAEPVQCYSREATARLQGLLPVGTRVRVELDPANGDARDRFNRGLGYLYRESDGMFINVVLVRGGFAEAYPYGDTDLHRDEIAEAEREARAARRGLWGICRVGG